MEYFYISDSRQAQKLIKYDFMFFQSAKFDYVGFKVIQGHSQCKIARSCWIKWLLKLNMSTSQLLDRLKSLSKYGFVFSWSGKFDYIGLKVIQMLFLRPKVKVMLS